MYIKDLELKNFRNYKDIKIDFNENVNLILGNNAQGKTNLIESVYMTSIGKSFRTSKDIDLIKFDEEKALIKVNAKREYIDNSIEIVVGRDSKKYIKKDGVNLKKISELLENVLVVIFSPEDLKIVKDEPEKRRKFIDRELCQIMPLYYDSLSNYKKALMQRNTYLKEKNVDKSILDIWDVQLAKFGSKIIRIRKDFIDKIQIYSSSIHSSITDGNENLVIKYKPNIKFIKDSREMENYYYDQLKKFFNNDFKNRTTTSGPHKDDINFYVNNINIRNFGSQGQQRTCALSLKLAELNLIKEETGEDAILLLDDVMSELDIKRQEFLIKTLKNNQLFITTTDIDEKLKKSFQNSKIIFVEEGKIISE